VVHPAAMERDWVVDLAAPGHRGEEARRELYALLLKAAMFEVRRRGVPDEDLAAQAAGDAMLAILKKLDTYRGESRFTTWAYKFALYEAAAKTRKRAWKEREVLLAPEQWATLATAPYDGDAPELLRAIARGIEQRLTQHQREVLLALAIDGVPIDVLAERLDTTRGALYKTLHDARRNLRAHLEQA
jgi:RNA polymerase sigma-70 factor (ECF subfamily)